MHNSLDVYDALPPDMINYLKHYGKHFNSKLYQFAASKMKKRDNTGQLQKITPYTKDQVDQLLNKFKITLENNELYDYVYIASMVKADFLGSSIKTEEQIALYIKDVIDDQDACEGLVFTRFYASCVCGGIPIEWSEML